MIPWKHRSSKLTFVARNVMDIRNTKAPAGCLGKMIPKHIMAAPIENQVFEHRDICLISNGKMVSINKWFTRNEEKKKEKEREGAYFKYLKANNFKLVGGKTIVKEEALKRLTAKENEDVESKLREKYMLIKENQKVEREKIIKKYRRHDLINKSPNIVLTSALKHAATLYERQKHYELQQQLREEEKKRKKIEHEESIRQLKIADELAMQAEKNRQRKEMEVKNFVKNQCLENEKKRQDEYMERITREKEDYMRSSAEWEEMQKIEEAKKLIRKKENLASLRRAAEKVQTKRLHEKKEDEEVYKVNEIIKHSILLRDYRVGEKLKQEKREKVNRNTAALMAYQAKETSIQQIEEEVYQNAIRKNEQEYQEKLKEKIDRLKTQAAEKNQNYQDDMKRQKEKEKEISELRRMEMIERYKKDEAMKYYDEISKQKEIDKKEAYRQDLIQQALEIEENKRLKKKLEDEYVLSNFAKQDDLFSEYGDEVLKYAQDRKWPTFPIEKAIKEYKKKHHVAFRKPNDLPCKS